MIKMQIEKIVLEKSAVTLLDKSEDCFDFAKAHHELAETMHQVAAQQIDKPHNLKPDEPASPVNHAAICLNLSDGHLLLRISRIGFRD